MKRYSVVYMDMGTTCDFKNRTLGTYKSLEQAQKEMNKDIKHYLKINNSLSITEQDNDFVLVGSEELGCQWQILTLEV